MSYTVLAHVATGDLATATLQNQLIDDLAVLKTTIANDGRISGEIQNFREELTTVAAAGTTTINLTLSNCFKVTLGANIATLTVSNWTASKGQPVTIRFLQDGTGGRTVAFPAGWKWPGGVAPTITATANKTDIVVLYSDDGGTTIFASLFTVNA